MAVVIDEAAWDGLLDCGPALRFLLGGDCFEAEGVGFWSVAGAVGEESAPGAEVLAEAEAARLAACRVEDLVTLLAGMSGWLSS